MNAPGHSVSIDRVVLTGTPGDAHGSAEIVGAQVQAALAQAGVGGVDAAAAGAAVAAQVTSAVEAAR